MVPVGNRSRIEISCQEGALRSQLKDRVTEVFVVFTNLLKAVNMYAAESMTNNPVNLPKLSFRTTTNVPQHQPCQQLSWLQSLPADRTLICGLTSKPTVSKSRLNRAIYAPTLNTRYISTDSAHHTTDRMHYVSNFTLSALFRLNLFATVYVRWVYICLGSDNLPLLTAI